MKLQDFNFTIKHMSGTSNSHAYALSHLEGVEKNLPKVGVILPDQLFIHTISEREPPEEELTEEGKGKRIALYHDSPVTGHLEVKHVIELIRRQGSPWKGLRKDIQKYIAGCIMGKNVKPNYGQPATSATNTK
jgi:hypothetical protein